MTPASIHSRTSRVPSFAWPWLPIWVATPVSRAIVASARASATVRVRGFSQYTCLPRRMASIAITAWVWSGVAMITASRSGSASSMRR